MKKHIFLSSFILTIFVFFQVAAQQKITANYSLPVLKEDFNEENKNWNYQTTYENFFVIDKGDFFLNRINKQNPYAILTNWQNELSKFHIRSAMKLAPDQSKDQTIGIIFMVQGDGKGAIVLEINREKEYRIKQLVGQYYKFLSGDRETQGWIKSSLINNKDDYNELEVKVFEGQMDFYINKKFLNSFNVDEYKYGGLGFLVGPNTKAKIDYFNVYTIDTEPDSVQYESIQQPTKLKGEELIAKLENDIDNLKLQVDEYKKKYQTYKQERDKEQEQNKFLLGKYEHKNDSLEIRTRSLSYLEDEMLQQGISQDLLLTLTTELREQIQRNEILDGEVGLYKDSIFYLHKKYQDLKLKLLTQVIDKRTQILKAKEAKEIKQIKEEAAIAKNKENPINKHVDLSKDKEEEKLSPPTKAEKSKDKKVVQHQKEENARPEETETIRPNPRSKKSSEVESARVQASSDSLIPTPIRTKVKKAKKSNRN